MSCRILLVDDHKIVRDGLRSLLETQSDLKVVGEAENGRKAVRLAAKLSPDLVIMDVTMPDLNGIDATRQILAEESETRVIVLSMHSSKHFVEGMLQAGVAGYMLKDCAAEELLQSIRAVLAGKVYLSPGITGLVIEGYLGRSVPADCLIEPELTPREREVLQLLAEGRTTREIAQQLYISGKTVDTHRKNIMEKLDLHSVAELTKYAIRIGLTEY